MDLPVTLVNCSVKGTRIKKMLGTAGLENSEPSSGLSIKLYFLTYKGILLFVSRLTPIFTV